MSGPTPTLRIGVAGLIGAGKTTLTTNLSKVFGLDTFYEDVKNPYLSDFYGDMATYSFRLQIALLRRRLKQAQQMYWSPNGAIQDRTIYEDAIFARILCEDKKMEQRDLDEYLELAHVVFGNMPRLSLIVYLDVTPEESLARIKMRNRSYEAGITLEYLSRLRDGYEAWIKEISKQVPVIRIPWSEFKDPEKVALGIQRAWRTEISSIHTLAIAECASPDDVVSN